MSLWTLQKPWQFRQVYRDGEKIDCKYAILFYYRTGDSTDGPFFGFVASKRIGNAVKRNRAKRLLRQVAADLLPRVKHRDLWIVLVARSGITELKTQQLADEIVERLENQ